MHWKPAWLITTVNNVNSSNENAIHIPKTSGKIQPDVKMGYISSVKDARKKLEELFKINQEPKES